MALEQKNTELNSHNWTIIKLVYERQQHKEKR